MGNTISRQKINIDDNWKFNFGNVTDAEKDFQELLNLVGCIYPKAINYKSYYIKPGNGKCKY